MPQSSQATSARQEHADLSPIAAVAIAELGDEVAFFEPDANEDVAGGPDREQQVPCRHDRHRPETEQKAEIQGMTHVTVEERLREPGCRDLMTDQACEYLVQSEQLEMVDEERTDQHQHPSEPENGPEKLRGGKVVYSPRNTV